MGGNLFKLGRLPRARYLEIEAELRAYLDRRFGRHLYRIPRYYGAKEDFGDIDILLSEDAIGESEDWTTLRKEIVQALGIALSKTDGRVFSTVFQDFQVDFFLTSHHEMNAKSLFMDFNDLGNFIGRLFRPFNLKYSEKGLFYVFRRETGGYSKDIFISRDWQRILTFVWLDYDKWVQGFDQLEEMFEWVLQSPYFRSGPYRDPQSRILRTLAKQRPTTRKFVAYLEERDIHQTFALDEPGEYFVPGIEAHFAIALAETIANERRLEKEANEIHAKFNGELVMDWYPSLQGKALGQFMRQFQEDFRREQLLKMTADEVEVEVRKRVVSAP